LGKERGGVGIIGAIVAVAFAIYVIGYIAGMVMEIFS